MSARHCFNYNITQWCASQKPIVDNDGNTGRCVRIVAADATRDIAIFEANFDYTPSNERALRLAAFEPNVGTRITMTGFPADQYRRGTLTTTENCWILRTRVNSPHGGRINDRSSLHNCTTYGGNSGGPMVAEDSDIALGLPFTYVPNDYRLRDPDNQNTAAYMAQSADFVAAHRSSLNEAGVIVAEDL